MVSLAVAQTFQVCGSDTLVRSYTLPLEFVQATDGAFLFAKPPAESLAPAIAEGVFSTVRKRDKPITEVMDVAAWHAAQVPWGLPLRAMLAGVGAAHPPAKRVAPGMYRRPESEVIDDWGTMDLLGLNPEPTVAEVCEEGPFDGLAFNETWHYEPGVGLRIEVQEIGLAAALTSGSGEFLGFKPYACAEMKRAVGPEAPEYQVVTEHILRLRDDEPAGAAFELLAALFRDLGQGAIRCFELGPEGTKGAEIPLQSVAQRMTKTVKIPKVDLETGELIGFTKRQAELVAGDVWGLRLDQIWSLHSSPFYLEKTVRGIVLLDAKNHDPLVPICFEMPDPAQRR